MDYNMKVTSKTSEGIRVKVLLTCIDKGPMLGATKEISMSSRTANSVEVGSVLQAQINDNSLVSPKK